MMLRAALLILLTVRASFGADLIEERVVSTGVKFRVVRVAPTRVSVVWKDDKGVPYRSFDKVWSAFAQKGKTVKFIMNAGIFEPTSFSIVETSSRPIAGRPSFVGVGKSGPKPM